MSKTQAWLKKVFAPRLYKLEKLQSPTLEQIIEILREATLHNELSSLIRTQVFKDFYANATKEELLKMYHEKFITINSLQGSGKFEFDEVKPLIEDKGGLLNNVAFALNYAPDEYILSNIGQILGKCRAWDSFSYEFKIEEDISLVVEKDENSEKTVYFKTKEHVIFINFDYIFSVTFGDRKIFLNEIPSGFEFKDSDSLTKLESLLVYLNQQAVLNLKRVSCIENPHEWISDLKTSSEDEGLAFNPWASGASHMALRVASLG